MRNEQIFIELRNSLAEYNKVISRKKQRLTPDFNLLYLISPNELQISKIIAEFLNPSGIHEHGSQFLEVFLNLFLNKKRKFTKPKKVSVITEFAQNVNGQIDIMLDFDQKYGIGIENKPFAHDQKEQISRYVDYLEKKYGSKNYSMIYISYKGSNPSENSLSRERRIELGNKFKVISYAELRNWFILCNEIAFKSGASRLAILISEIAEYINLEFLNTNKVKNEMLSKTIKNNIIDAFEIVNLWEKNEKAFIELWSHEINALYNTELPRLVLNGLQKRNIVNDSWVFTNGDFDIRINAARGFGIKKKNWENFEYAILSSKNHTPKGSRDFFPAIRSKTKMSFNIPNYIEKYSTATGSEIMIEQWSVPPTIWWTVFPDKTFGIWGYEKWTEIKEDGRTVNYLIDFFEKLITVSEQDIDRVEDGLRELISGA